MKSIDIYIVGKYNYKFNMGTWEYYLSYKGAVIKRCGSRYNTQSPERTSLLALYTAINDVKEPCIIVVHSKRPLGFKFPKKSKNQDVICKIQNLINRTGHIVKYDTNIEAFNIVNSWEETYGLKGKDIYRINNTNKTCSNDKAINEQITNNIKNKTPNEVFEHNSKDWRDMYNDIIEPSTSVWSPISGGYD